MCLFLSRWNGGSTESMHKRAKSKGVSGKLATSVGWPLGHLAACDLVLYWSDGWVWQGWTKSGRHATPVRLQKHQHQGSKQQQPSHATHGSMRPSDLLLGCSLTPLCRQQAAASFRSVVSADLPPSLR